MHFGHWTNWLLDPRILVLATMILTLLALIFSSLLQGIAKIIHGDNEKTKKNREALEHQNTLLDETLTGMDRMEQRINNLETILMNRSER